jgi:hypothetical protein
MDSILESAWRNHEKPFQEETLAHENLIPISTLCLILLTIVDYCENLYSNCRLYSFDDWHAHDGYITSCQVTNFHDLHRAFESDTTLHNSMQGDDFVYKAIYPDTRDFLLRYYVSEIEKMTLNIHLDYGAISLSQVVILTYLELQKD